MRIYLACALLLLLCCNAEAKKKHYSSSNTLLSPSRELLRRQNIAADQMDLVAIQTDVQVSEMVAQGILSPLPITKALRVNPALPQERRYASSFVTPFLLSLSEQFYAKFHSPLVVDSAVRSAETQTRLRRINRNAAPADGEEASSHMRGSTFDLGKRGMTRAQKQWFEALLSYEVAMNHAIVENEKACYHIMVIGETE
jgi:Family of unknown function (DUF5715)